MQCEHCGREFHQKDSYQDHVLSKHTGVHTDIKPSWCAKALQNSTTKKDEVMLEERAALPNATATELNDNESHICPICELRVASLDILQHHIEDGINPENYSKSLGKAVEDISHICTNCKRVCRDERSLKQHYNFCISKKVVITAFPKNARKCLE